MFGFYPQKDLENKSPEQSTNKLLCFGVNVNRNQETTGSRGLHFDNVCITGPIQFVGPVADRVNHTLLLELGAQA